jgi:hypothetical protein
MFGRPRCGPWWIPGRFRSPTTPGRGKFTFAEVEENDADLAKLRRWLEAIAGRDRYDAAGRTGAEQAVAEADRALQAFAERSADAESPDQAGER